MTPRKPRPEEIVTAVAHAGYTEHRFFGHRVFADLCGTSSFSDLVYLSVAGRLPSRRERDVLDALAAAYTLADPRIPPLKLTRIVAAYGDPVTATCAGVCSTARARIGPAVSGPAARFLQSVQRQVGDGDDDELAACLSRAKTRGPLPGFGIPFRGRDERIEAIRRALGTLGFAGTYTELAARLERVSEQSLRLPANVTLWTAAVGLDLGLCPEGIVLLATCLALHCFSANAMEAARQGPGPLARLPASRVRYVGPPPRELPPL